MSIYSDPPEARTFRQDNAVLLVCWWCNILAMFIILFRVGGRYIRSEKLFREDWIAFACIIPLLGRIACVHVVLYFGTNNVQLLGLSELQIYHRSIGSKVVLLSRMLNATALWMLKLTISEFFRRLIWNISATSHEKNLKFIRWILLITFLGVIVANFVECRPLPHYWQVTPDPGAQCRQGYAQLLTLGVMNVLTDLLLVIFPISIIIKSKMSLKKKTQLVLLFSLSILPGGVTIFRIPRIIDRHGSQNYRSLLASVEILIAAICANALVLGSFVRDRGVKKQKFKITSTAASVEPIESLRGKFVQVWGSDEDLVRDLGLGVNPGHLQPIIDPKFVGASSHENWHLHQGKRKFSGELDLIRLEQQLGARKGSIPRRVSRRVSFADIDVYHGIIPLRRESQKTFHSDPESSTFDQMSSASADLETGLSPASLRKIPPAHINDIGNLLKVREDKFVPTGLPMLHEIP
ncbi:putative protein/integral membrane protein [Erysiphe neolycopersici]|uniref:Rhodopsin domain-containing protein n=1 Tax=Erysiphe neolycopersici TaxID=212602 RepID=A0A420HB56_9PEZI|nr:putative protein/integral membrane protein [Erysiphe neolycopersici]